MSTPLDRLGRRVTQEPFFLAAVLESYAHGEGLDDAALAARLECDMPTLTMLRLCRAPRQEAPHFWEDVVAIAGRFGVDADRLADMVRHGWALARLRGADEAPKSSGFLMAARDDERPVADDPEKKT